MIAMPPSPKWTKIFMKVLINLFAQSTLYGGRGSTAGGLNMAPTFIAINKENDRIQKHTNLHRR